MHAADGQPTSVRITLSPFPALVTSRELDSHVSGPTGGGERFHVSWLAPTYVDRARQVVVHPDDLAYPPAQRVDLLIADAAEASGEYRYWVHNYGADHYREPPFGATDDVVGVDVLVDGQSAGRWTQPASPGGQPGSIWLALRIIVGPGGLERIEELGQFTTGDETSEY